MSLRHPGLLLHTLVALGVLPPLPEPRSQEDLDREDAEREERLRASRTGTLPMTEFTPPEVTAGALRILSSGEGPHFGADYAREVAAREASVLTAPTLRYAAVDAEWVQPCGAVWARLCAIPREPRTHNRKAQRAAKKARSASKKRRGW